MEGKLLLYDVSTWGSSWSHKFFVLENGALSWFASQPPARRGRRSAGTSPEASVVVNQVKLAPSDATSGERAFCVSESEQKYVVLRAETDQDLQRWVSALGFAASASAASASSSSSSAPASLPVSIPSRAPTPLNACGGGGDGGVAQQEAGASLAAARSFESSNRWAPGSPVGSLCSEGSEAWAHATSLGACGTPDGAGGGGRRRRSLSFASADLSDISAGAIMCDAFSEQGSAHSGQSSSMSEAASDMSMLSAKMASVHVGDTAHASSAGTPAGASAPAGGAYGGEGGDGPAVATAAPLAATPLVLAAVPATPGSAPGCMSPRTAQLSFEALQQHNAQVRLSLLSQVPGSYCVTFRVGNLGLELFTESNVGTKVKQIFDYTQASRLGVQPGSQLLFINDVDVSRMNHEQCKHHIMASGRPLDITFGPGVVATRQMQVSVNNDYLQPDTSGAQSGDKAATQMAAVAAALQQPSQPSQPQPQPQLQLQNQQKQQEHGEWEQEQQRQHEHKHEERRQEEDGQQHMKPESVPTAEEWREGDERLPSAAMEVLLDAVSIGISFHSVPNPQVLSPTPHFYHNIDMVVPGSAADNAKIPVPSRIVMVNGRSVQTVYHDECVAMIATAPRPVRLVLHVEEHPLQTQTRQPRSQEPKVPTKVAAPHSARGAYRCGKCGQKKIGHVCPFVEPKTKKETSITGCATDAESQCDLRVTGNRVTRIDHHDPSGVDCDDSSPAPSAPDSLLCAAASKAVPPQVSTVPPTMPIGQLPQLVLPDECQFSLVAKLQQAVKDGQGDMLVQQMVRTAQREQELMLKHHQPQDLHQHQHQATIGRVSLQQQELVHTAFSGGTQARLE